MDKSIDISVIIPMYNAENTIIKCIDSVVRELNSTNYIWEILVINDGSSDSSSDIVISYKKNSDFKNFIFLFSQENKGVSSARNLGLLYAKGEYIAFNDSDDYWESGRVEKQVTFLRQNKDVVMITGLYAGMKFKYDGSISLLTIKEQLFKNHVSPTGAMIRRSIIAGSIFFNEEMVCGEDVDFFNRIILKGKTFIVREKFASSILNKYSWGDVGLSSNLWQMEKGELMNLTYIYRNGYVNISLYLIAVSFSFSKFIRRVIVSFIRRNVNR